MKSKIYALETTNYCNAKCDYCPHEKMSRARGFVSLETVNQVIVHMLSNGQKYVALHHMGEPLLHPKIGTIIQMFKDAGIHTEFSTNGALLAKHGKTVLDAGLTRLRIAVDYFYKDERYIKNLQDFLKLSAQYSTDIHLHTIVGNDLTPFENINLSATLEHKNFDNWAGEVDGESTLEKSNECYFKKYNYVVVLFDGRVVPCCMDYNATHVIGRTDNLERLKFKQSYNLCKGCANMQFASGGEWTK